MDLLGRQTAAMLSVTTGFNHGWLFFNCGFDLFHEAPDLMNHGKRDFGRVFRGNDKKTEWIHLTPVCHLWHPEGGTARLETIPIRANGSQERHLGCGNIQEASLPTG